MSDVREALAAALPDALQPVGAGLKFNERMYRNRNTPTERLTGYGALLLDALEPVVARLIAEAEERGAARVRERVEAVIPPWPSGEIRHDDGSWHTSPIQCDRCEGYPHATCVSASEIRAALTDEAQP